MMGAFVLKSFLNSFFSVRCMISTLTAILLGAQLSYSPVSAPKLEQSTPVLESSHSLYQKRPLPEKKEIPAFVDSNKYFIRMEELCFHPCMPFTSLDSIRDYQQRLRQVRTNRHQQYLSRHQSLRVTRENRNNSWKPKPDTN